MTSDAVIVALIQESVMSSSPVRQMAARVMLDLARSHRVPAISRKEMEIVRDEIGLEVAEEVDALADDLGIHRIGP